QTVEDDKARLGARLGDVPPEPATGFVGRSRELLALQRLLRHERYAVVRGQGGEGKTALAAEFARWMVRSQQMRRGAFVSVETHGHVAAVLDVVGRQLVGKDYSAAAFDDREQAILPIERALREQPTLLVMDNMESILLPPFLETPEALTEEAGRELHGILALCARLLKVGETRLVFTSREALPAPFDADRHRRELHRLDREDAVKLVERALDVNGGAGSGAALDAAREVIEALVEAVHGHARTLALLAPALQRDGVEQTRLDLVKLMEEMNQRYPVGTPGSREKSVFASVELSLRRLSPVNRDRARVLGVFHGGVDLDMLRAMMEWEEADVGALAFELIGTGLATPNRYNHLTLNPALCPYLRGGMESTEREALTARWVEAMRRYVEFLVQQQHQNAELAATLTGLELPNLFALLDLVQRAGDVEGTTGLATLVYSLMRDHGKPRLMERVGQVRDVAAKEMERTLGDAWTHAQFTAAGTRIEQQLDGGRMREAFEGAQQLLQRARGVGGQAYPGADYDLAAACFLLARVVQTAGGSEQALPLLDEARQRFEAVTRVRANQAAEWMASACLAEKGDCLRNLGRLDEAAAAYEENIRCAEQLDDARQVAVGKAQLGSVRRNQRRYLEALAAYAEARERFTQLDEPGTVAVSWHQTGMVYQEAGQPEAAEDAYRKSLAIKVRLRDVVGQANTLLQLGNLYLQALDRTEEAAAFYRQATDKYVEIQDVAKEVAARSNLADTLRRLHRFDKARQEIRRAIECKGQFGHAAEPWKTWFILANIETDAGHPAAAAEAKGKAIACYLAYRRDGGENHSDAGRVSLTVSQSLRAGDAAEAATLLQQQLPRFEAAGFGGFIRALQAIAAGRRDRTLADAPELDCTMAAEILFLIETLEKAGKG
ncbi:MAG: tetratricopeptide repeat protein, partial [Planctomycetales bacterium]